MLRLDVKVKCVAQILKTLYTDRRNRMEIEEVKSCIRGADSEEEVEDCIEENTKLPRNTKELAEKANVTSMDVRTFEDRGARAIKNAKNCKISRVLNMRVGIETWKKKIMDKAREELREGDIYLGELDKLNLGLENYRMKLNDAISDITEEECRCEWVKRPPRRES